MGVGDKAWEAVEDVWALSAIEVTSFSKDAG